MMTFQELISYARSQNCSDVHITAGTDLAVRHYGKLEMLSPIPTAEESEAMILESLTEEQKKQVLSGKDLDLAIFMEDGCRLRANIYHQRNNLAATYRILNEKIPSFEELRVPSIVKDFIKEPRGLVLITGPTGSGKTTTLASMINYINTTMAKHVLTIEDPIEYVYYHAKSMIHQREVGKDVASFADALHSALREDPDIILVGEMRDQETISAAITAAETGHLVLSTLHTSSAAQTVDRIIDSYPQHAQNQARAQLASVLKGVITQVLVPMELEEGMIVATEVMVNNEAVANQIREGKTHLIPTTMMSSGNIGMHTLNGDLKRLEKEQMISHETALKYCSNAREYMNIK